MIPSTPTLVVSQANLISLLVLAALIAAFFGTGIYVVSGRWSAKQPQRDAKTLAHWEKTRSLGFGRYLLRDSLPFCWTLFFCRAFHDAWRTTGRFALSPEVVIDTSLLATAVGFVLAALNWREIRRRAEEVHDRAARLQDERHG